MEKMETLDVSGKFTRCFNAKYWAEKDPKFFAELTRIEHEEIPRIIEILEQYGQLLPIEMNMWYKGYAFFLKLNKRPIYLKLEYSDKRFQIEVARIPNFKTVNNWFDMGYEKRFCLREYVHFCNIERLPQVLNSFIVLF
jgi:hypothetical protein